MRMSPALIALLLPLAGCMEATPPAVTNGSDGVAQKLTMGVTRAEADVALGMDAGFERNPKNFDEECVSYAYGGVPTRYVHAVFRQGRLVAASDAHPTLCTYGSLIKG